MCSAKNLDLVHREVAWCKANNVYSSQLLKCQVFSLEVFRKNKAVNCKFLDLFVDHYLIAIEVLSDQ